MFGDNKENTEKENHIQIFGMYLFSFAIIIILLVSVLTVSNHFHSQKTDTYKGVVDVVLEEREKGCKVGYNLGVTESIAENSIYVSLNFVTSLINVSGDIQVGTETRKVLLPSVLANDSKNSWLHDIEKTLPSDLDKDTSLYTVCSNEENEVTSVEEVIWNE